MLRKHVKMKLSKLILALSAIFFVLHTTPVYCECCMIEKCGHGAPGVISFWDVGTDGVFQENECCGNGIGQPFKTPEFGTDILSPCNCFLKGTVADSTQPLISSEPSPIPLVFEFSDSLHISSNPKSCLQFVRSEPRVLYVPIFVLNSTFLC